MVEVSTIGSRKLLASRLLAGNLAGRVGRWRDLSGGGIGGVYYLWSVIHRGRESAEGRASPHFFIKKLSTELSTEQVFTGLKASQKTDPRCVKWAGAVLCTHFKYLH